VNLLLENPGQKPAGRHADDGANRLSRGPNGNFCLSMTGPLQVIEITPDGSLVRIFGAPGTEGALGEQPNAVDFDDAGHVYVSQGRNRTGRGVMVYEPDGTLAAACPTRLPRRAARQRAG
jgi:hypothetical protein